MSKIMAYLNKIAIYELKLTLDYHSKWLLVGL